MERLHEQNKVLSSSRSLTPVYIEDRKEFMSNRLYELAVIRNLIKDAIKDSRI